MRKRNERGAALMFAIFVLLILSAGTGLLWQQLHGNLEQQRQSWHREQAFQLAEAGLERAVAELQAGNAAFRGAEEVALGSGVYTVSVTPGNARGTFEMESWGTLNGGQRHFDRACLRGRLRLTPNGKVVSYTWIPIKGKQP